MIAILYTTTSDRKVINKTLTEVKQTDINLLDDTELKSPYIEIANIDIATLKNVNYMYIPDFGRYYYINDITLLTSGNVSLTANIDVLMSFKTDILNLVGTVKRAENLKNGYIIDDSYKSVAYSKITTKRFPNAMTNDTFILMTVG